MSTFNCRTCGALLDTEADDSNYHDTRCKRPAPASEAGVFAVQNEAIAFIRNNPNINRVPAYLAGHASATAALKGRLESVKEALAAASRQLTDGIIYDEACEALATLNAIIGEMK